MSETTKILTAEDVLSGGKDITVNTRDGREITIRLTAVDWRRARSLVAEFVTNKDSMVFAIAALPPDQATDAFLNTLTPDSIGKIEAHGIALCLGEEVQKKMQGFGQEMLNALIASPNVSAPKTS